MEPGAGQFTHCYPTPYTHTCQIFIGGGEFKYLRGFDPYVVSSVHWFRSPRLQASVSDFLVEERTHNQVGTAMLLLHARTIDESDNLMICTHQQALADYLIRNSAVNKKQS